MQRVNRRTVTVLGVVTLVAGGFQLVGLGVSSASAADALCADFDRLDDVNPASDVNIVGRVFRCDDRSEVTDVTVRFTVDRQCRSFDPATESVTTIGADSHLEVRQSEGAQLDVVFTLPGPCAEGITELVATVQVEKQGFEPSDPIVVLKRLYRPEMPCDELYDSLDAAYREYISTYEELIRAVAVTPIESPPHLVVLQRAYFATKLEADPRKAYQSGIAAINALNSEVSKTPIEEPLQLWWYSGRYHHAKFCYEQLMRR